MKQTPRLYGRARPLCFFKTPGTGPYPHWFSQLTKDIQERYDSLFEQGIRTPLMVHAEQQEATIVLRNGQHTIAALPVTPMYHPKRAVKTIAEQLALFKLEEQRAEQEAKADALETLLEAVRKTGIHTPWVDSAIRGLRGVTPETLNKTEAVFKEHGSSYTPQFVTIRYQPWLINYLKPAQKYGEFKITAAQFIQTLAERKSARNVHLNRVLGQAPPPMALVDNP